LIRQFEDAVIGLVQAGGDQIGVILLRGDGVADKQGADFLAGFGGGFGHGELNVGGANSEGRTQGSPHNCTRNSKASARNPSSFRAGWGAGSKVNEGGGVGMVSEFLGCERREIPYWLKIKTPTWPVLN
jgi:hypothetical protein